MGRLTKSTAKSFQRNLHNAVSKTLWLLRKFQFMPLSLSACIVHLCTCKYINVLCGKTG